MVIVFTQRLCHALPQGQMISGLVFPAVNNIINININVKSILSIPSCLEVKIAKARSDRSLSQSFGQE